MAGKEAPPNPEKTRITSSGNGTNKKYINIAAKTLSVAYHNAAIILNFIAVIVISHKFIFYPSTDFKSTGETR